MSDAARTIAAPLPTAAGGGVLHRRGTIAVVHLRGTARERGRQHGELLRDEIRGGIVTYFCDVFRTRLRKAAEQSGKLVARLIPLAVKEFYLANFIFPRLIVHMPHEMREELAGLAEGAGIDVAEIAQTSVFADLYLYFLGKNFQGMGKLLPDSAFDACTSLAAWGPATADGSFLYARNLDFFGVGIWDRRPAVFYHHPNQGMPYVSIACAGVGPAGITGINQAGLTVAPQLKRTRAVSLDGLPMLYLATEIVRRAESLDDAVRLAQEGPKPAVGFSLVITDARHRTAAALECSHDGVLVRRRATGNGGWNDPDLPAGTFVQTNHYTTAHREKELDINAAIRAHTLGRYRRAQDLLRRDHGRITPQDMVEYLADHFDPFAGRERSIGNIIVQPCNISAVVFRPDAGEFWVAEGDTPASHSRYRRFALDEAPGVEETHSLDPPRWVDEPRFAGYRDYVRAYADNLGDADPESLIALVARARACDPEEPIYAYICGLLRLKQARWADAEQELAAAGALAGSDLPHRRAAIGLWAAVARSLQGKWQEARETFAQAAGDERLGSDVRGWARTWAERAPEADDLRVMTPDLQYGDMMVSP